MSTKEKYRRLHTGIMLIKNKQSHMWIYSSLDESYLVKRVSYNTRYYCQELTIGDITQLHIPVEQTWQVCGYLV